MYDEGGYNCEDIEIANSREQIVKAISNEMWRQVQKWGVQQHPQYKNADVFAHNSDYITTERAKELCDMRLGVDECSWQDILNEEVLEARDEAIKLAYGHGNPQDLRDELIQVAAVAGSAIQSLDREFNRCLECGAFEGLHKMSCDTGYKQRK